MKYDQASAWPHESKESYCQVNGRPFCVYEPHSGAFCVVLSSEILSCQAAGFIMIIGWRKQSLLRLFSLPNDTFGSEWFEKSFARCSLQWIHGKTALLFCCTAKRCGGTLCGVSPSCNHYRNICTTNIRFYGVFVSEFPPCTFFRLHGIMQSSGRDNTRRSDQYEIQPDKGTVFLKTLSDKSGIS